MLAGCEFTTMLEALQNFEEWQNRARRTNQWRSGNGKGMTASDGRIGGPRQLISGDEGERQEECCGMKDRKEKRKHCSTENQGQ